VRRAAGALLAALALAGCSSARLPAETPDGAALDVALSVRETAAGTAGAAVSGANPARLRQLWGDAVEAQHEALKVVPSVSSAKPPLIEAADATTLAAQALATRAGAGAARTQLDRAQAALGQVADALDGRLPDRSLQVARLREPLG
jgi:hypothetical protein